MRLLLVALAAPFLSSAAGLPPVPEEVSHRPSEHRELLVPDAPAPRLASRRVAFRQVYLEADPQGRVVAAAIRFSVGSAEDPTGLEGTAALLGRLLQDEGDRRLVDHGAAVEVEVRRDELVVTMVAAPGTWERALVDLTEVLLDAALPGSRLTPVREETLEILTFESGAPVRSFELERERFFRGAEDRGSRPLRGTLGSVELLAISNLEEYRRVHILEESAVMAVTGPVTRSDLEDVVGGPVRIVAPSGGNPGEASNAAPPTRAGAAPPAPPTRSTLELDLHRNEAPLEAPTTPAGPPAWSVGERSIVDRQLTSTWMAVGFPFPRGTPELLLDFIGHLVLESLTPSPPDPGLYGAEVTSRTVDEAPVLVVTASVDPRITSQWEARLASSLDSIAEQPPRGAFFELARRRFRSQLLLRLAVPEERARWLAREAAQGAPTLPDPVTDVWRIRRDEVADAARVAGPGRTILYGPLDMMDR